jgi:hypothetical protein
VQSVTEETHLLALNTNPLEVDNLDINAIITDFILRADSKRRNAFALAIKNRGSVGYLEADA